MEQMERLAGITLATLLLAAAPAPAQNVGDAESQYVTEARAEAAKLLERLGSELRKRLATGGPAEAIAVCKELAPNLAGLSSRQTGWRITRVSLKVRNPLLGTPDPWEQRALMDFDALVGAGARPEGLERWEVVDEPQGKAFRYLKAIPMQAMCLQCHGPRDALPESVRTILAETYPHDQAVGYASGSVRGGLSIKRRLGSP